MPNLPTIKVRRIVLGEGDTYRQIRLEALENAPNAFGSSYEAEAAEALSYFEECVVSGSIFGAFDGEKVIGVAGFYQQSGLKQSHKGVLWGMYVNPSYRKSGAGRKLVQTVVDYATNIVELVTLSVVTGNESAIALYSDMGFRAYGTEPRALKIGIKYLSETLMIRDLD